MPRFTDNLNLKLPLGSKYWNYDTWCENMKILDKAFKDLQEIIINILNASHVTVSNNRLDATNMQDAIDELQKKTSALRYINITEDTRIIIPSEGHSYLVLTFGDTVYDVDFDPTETTRELTWMNGIPTFEPNSSYEISFLKLSGIWYKNNSAIDYTRFFEYYIQDGIFYVTDIKAEEWYDWFADYNFFIPNTVNGYPVVIDAQYQY